MSLNTSDLQVGIDFTGLGPNATAAQHNQLVSQASPQQGDFTVDTGISFNGVTTDTAVGVPDVPDASVTTKWQRYPWYRRPHSADPSQLIRQYMWNNAIASVATYLKWTQVTPDLAAIETDVATANSNASTALASANSALSTANTASTDATTAVNDAIAAQNAAALAQAVANAASSSSTVAVANASAALTASSSATAAATANIPANRLVGYSAGFQMLRSNSSASVAEWFTPANEYTFISNTALQTPIQTVAGAGDRTWSNPAGTLTTQLVLPSITSPGGLATLSGNNITMVPGVYRIHIAFQLNSTFKSVAGSGSPSPLTGYQILLIRNSDGAVQLQSPAFTTAATTFSQFIDIFGLFTISNASTSLVYSLVMITTGIASGTNQTTPVASTGSVQVFPIQFELERIGVIP